MDEQSGADDLLSTASGIEVCNCLLNFWQICIWYKGKYHECGIFGGRKS